MVLKITPLDAPLGARITGIDLSRPLSDGDFEKISAAWVDHQVLIFPGQTLTGEEQAVYGRRFGEFPKRKRYEGRNETDTVDRSVMLVSNIRKDGKPIGSLPDGEMMYHSDGAYDEHPYKFTMLYAVEIPSTGGNTCFANLYKAYDLLPERLKSRLAGCHAVHGYYSGTVIKDQNVGDYSGQAVHPLFVRHPESGRTALFASRLMTLRIVELSQTESDEVLSEIFDLCERPDMIYEHVWSIGDFVTWDNRCVNHARTDFPESERRLLRRVTIQGVKPEPAT